jgi:probable F420-dependent oxidoreductase
MWAMSVRIGFGLGTAAAGPPDGARLGALAAGLERHGFDSLWLSERIGSEAVDPVVGLTWAAAVTTRLKLGFSVMVLPGRNPALVAKQLASLDRLAGGRLLPAFGLGTPQAQEHQAFAVRPEERAAWLEEAMPLLRRFWREDSVDHRGPRFRFEGVRVLPRPAGRMEMWLGGAGPRQLDRIGRLADGWLASFTTPEEARAGRAAIEASARACGRSVDPGHFGALVAYAEEAVDAALVEALLLRARRGRAAVPVGDLVALGLDRVAPLIERHVDAGISKFVLVPLSEPDRWDASLERLARAIAPLQGSAQRDAAGPG